MNLDNKEKFILVGAGKYGERALDWYGAENVFCFCDNMAMSNSMLAGKKVVSFLKLKEIYQDYIVVITVAKNKFVRELMAQLDYEDIPYILFKDTYEAAMAQGKDKQTIFTDIYQQQKWGSDDHPFYSGPGSHEKEIIAPYIAMLRDFVINNHVHRICEIGCGDFNIMNQVLNDMDLVEYNGIDVVPDLVNYNVKKFGKTNRRFICMDASNRNTNLPPADLLIVRQVLQHLDNQSIKNILQKSSAYHLVLVTESIYDDKDAIYNLDKASGVNIRLHHRSGVYIEQPPFSLCSVAHLLKVVEGDAVIRTSLVIN